MPNRPYEALRYSYSYEILPVHEMIFPFA
uniref:Uncharacterized protein n=1 Tax=Rhizophora mucronata TaxID=61149 RepID=A0A2P2PVA4_RHIMU